MSDEAHHQAYVYTDFGGSSVDTVGKYPGYSGSQYIAIMAVLTEESGHLKMDVVMTGLEPNVTGGIHIHTGMTCDAGSDEVGGHYYPDMVEDPWNSITYTSNAMGQASLTLGLSNFSLTGTVRPVMGRALVVHLADGTRAACGLIVPATPPASCMEDGFCEVAAPPSAPVCVCGEQKNGLEAMAGDEVCAKLVTDSDGVSSIECYPNDSDGCGNTKTLCTVASSNDVAGGWLPCDDESSKKKCSKIVKKGKCSKKKKMDQCKESCGAEECFRR
jgi:hypothetical protein